jgi:branched-chain amino acid aminotransferase
MKRADLDFANLDFSYRKMDYNIKYYYKNGSWGKAQLFKEDYVDMHIAATCLHYGQNCFEGLKVFENKNGEIVAFRPDENFNRMSRSAKRIYMQPPTEEIFYEALNKVVDLNRKYVPPYGTGASFYVRPLLLGISPHIGLKPAEEFIFLTMATPVGPYFKGGFKPIKVMVVEDMDRAAPHGVGDVKVAGNYAAGFQGIYKAKDNGYSDVIYLDAVHRKYIDELGTSNFVAILKDGTYVTPQSSSILPSITNMSLRTIAEEDFGWKVEQRPVSIDEIENFAEVGCCGTAAVITPVGTIRYKDREYNFHDNGKSAGPKLTQLYERLSQIRYGEIEDKHNWLYKIKLK